MGQNRGRQIRPGTPQTLLGAGTNSRRKRGPLATLHDQTRVRHQTRGERVSESKMLALMGPMSRAMLERYSHIRMAAKRDACESSCNGKSGYRLVAAKSFKMW